MPQLTPHHSNKNKDIRVQYTIELKEKQLFIKFTVKNSPISTNASFLKDGWGNIGLWDYDVVEVFVQFSDQADGHYLELQVSPLSQKFALLIKRPRVEVEKVTNLKSEASGSESENGFEALFKIDYRDIPGKAKTKTNIIKAGLFACLGKGEGRNFFALNINTEAQADFHRPELFKEIGRYES